MFNNIGVYSNDRTFEMEVYPNVFWVPSMKCKISLNGFSSQIDCFDKKYGF